MNLIFHIGGFSLLLGALHQFALNIMYIHHTLRTPCLNPLEVQLSMPTQLLPVPYTHGINPYEDRRCDEDKESNNDTKHRYRKRQYEHLMLVNFGVHLGDIDVDRFVERVKSVGDTVPIERHYHVFI